MTAWFRIGLKRVSSAFWVKEVCVTYVMITRPEAESQEKLIQMILQYSNIVANSSDILLQCL